MFDTLTWLAAYHHTWITHNAEQLAQLFTEDAVSHAHPFQPPYRGRAEIQAYWQRSTPSQEDLEVQWGTPIVSGNRVAIEWWAMMPTGCATRSHSGWKKEEPYDKMSVGELTSKATSHSVLHYYSSF